MVIAHIFCLVLCTEEESAAGTPVLGSKRGHGKSLYGRALLIFLEIKETET